MIRLLNLSSVETGHRAEVAAAEYLVRAGYEIRAMNWRRRTCEIDIVAYKARCLHFVEVKFRARATQGNGLEYVTPAKLRRMRFGARVYCQAVSWRGEINLAAIEVSGPDHIISDFIESISYDV